MAFSLSLGSPLRLSAATLVLASGTVFAQSNICATATPAGVGSYSGTTASATNDGQSGCGNSDTAPDVWYSYTATENALLVVTTCGGADWDTVVGIHTGCPATAANAIACNDDNCGLQSRTSAAVVAGQTYYIRVAGYGGATGAYTVNLSLAEPPPPPTDGPDVWIEDLIDIAYYATTGNVAAYAIGTDACNQGDVPAEWQSSNNRHPVIAQNLFRLKAGRFEQVGQSWLKHGFASTNSGACGTCNVPPGGGSQLGTNCSDAYGSGLNGSQGNLGPRSQVNPTTGVFPYPFSAPGFSGDVARRLQVNTADVIAAQNPGALYFGECHYVTQDDAQWGNGLNNASYKRLNMASYTAPAWAGATVRQQHAINAWAANDTGVSVSNFDYPEAGVTPGSTLTGRFLVASKATNNGDGTWSYEYAVQNVNSDRAAGEFSIDLPPGAVVTNIGFHDVPAHSGEPFDGTDWNATLSPYAITWRTTPHSTNANANAIRWGTLYNFRFTADVAPIAGSAAVSLFKPAAANFPRTVIGNATVPNPVIACVADFNGDGGVDGADVNAFFAAWEAGVPAADANLDGGVDGSDAESFFFAWTNGGC